MKTVCEQNKCTGCMACIDACAQNAIKIEDSCRYYNAVIDERKCTDCGKCQRICAQNNPCKMNNPQSWYQGWALDSVRVNSSSGGLAASISHSFIEKGGYVCSCAFENSKFKFKITNKKEELVCFAGSKYVKSNPEHIYSRIRKLLVAGQEILFIGLPCQVSALKNFIGKKTADNLYTIDLICHGTPSPKILELFLKEEGVSLCEIKDIQFRKKTTFNVYKEYQGFVPNGIQDDFTIGFLNALFYTENCYECNYAKMERCGDLTLGDSWGSTLNIEEQRKGISLILCQTTKGKQLLEWTALHLEDVDIDKAKSVNHQLQRPAFKHKNTEKFFDMIEKNKSFHDSIRRCCIKQSLKQIIKGIMIKFDLYKYNGPINQDRKKDIL